MNAAQVLREVQHSIGTKSSALALTRQRAVLRAQMEAYERCASSFRGDEYYVSSVLRSLDGPAVRNVEFHPDAHPWAARLPVPDDEIVDWTPAWSLTHAAFRWVMMPICYFGFPRGREFALAQSRGVAAGPSLAFCVCNGIHELIETISLATWERTDHAMPRVDLNGFLDSDIADLKTAHEGDGRDIWVLDVSLPELPGYTFAALSYDPTDTSVVLGTAADSDAASGIRRALLECTQMLANLRLSGAARERATTLTYGLLRRHRPAGTLARACYVRSKTYPRTIQFLVDALRDAGVEVLVVDLTREEVPIQVARILFVNLP